MPFEATLLPEGGNVLPSSKSITPMFDTLLSVIEMSVAYSTPMPLEPEFVKLRAS